MKRKQLLFASDVVKEMVLDKVAEKAVIDVEELAQRTMDSPTIAQNISTLIIQHIAYMHLRIGDVRARPMNGVEGLLGVLESTFAACPKVSQSVMMMIMMMMSMQRLLICFTSCMLA